MDILESGFAVNGAPIVLYNILKTAFTFYFFMILVTCGSLFQKIIFPRTNYLPMGLMRYIIVCAFLGSSVLGLIMFILGFMNLYSLKSALLITAPIIFVSPFTLNGLIPAVNQKLNVFFSAKRSSYFLSFTYLLLFTIGVAFLVLIIRVLLPSDMPGDVWGQYLPYYWEVIQTGGIWPNEHMIQFYHSKGAGLFFLSILLTDIFGAPIVSWCFMIMVSFMVFDLVRDFVDDLMWPLLGLFLVICYYLAHYSYSITFSKHHLIISGYIVFSAWCAIRLMDSLSESDEHLFVTAGAVSSFYASLYIYLISLPIAFGLWAATLIYFLFSRQKIRVLGIFIIGGAAIIGSLTTISINYAITGLGGLVPSHLFNMVNIEQFKTIWSPAILEYIEKVGGGSYGLSNLFYIDFKMIGSILRMDWLVYILIFCFVAVHILLKSAIISFRDSLGVVKSIKMPVLTNLRRINIKAIVVYATFVAGAILIVIVSDSTGAMRFVSFTGVFMILLLILCAVYIFGSANSPQYNGVELFIVTFAIGVLFYLYSFVINPKIPKRNYANYLTGRISMSEALLKGRYSRPVFGNLLLAKQYANRRGRVMHMTTLDSPEFLLPFPPVVIDGCSAVTNNIHKIASGTPEDAIRIFKKAGINYFSFEMRQKYHGPLVFSRLFKAHNLNKYFTVAMAKDDFVMITWRERGEPMNLPVKFIQWMEMKQTGVLEYIKSEDFYVSITDEFKKQTLGDYAHANDSGIQSINSQEITRELEYMASALIEERVLKYIRVVENKQLFKKYINEFNESLWKQESNYKDQLRPYQLISNEEIELFVEKVSVEVVSKLRNLLELVIINEFGADIAREGISGDNYSRAIYERVVAKYGYDY